MVRVEGYCETHVIEDADADRLVAEGYLAWCDEHPVPTAHPLSEDALELVRALD